MGLVLARDQWKIDSLIAPVQHNCCPITVLGGHLTIATAYNSQGCRKRSLGTTWGRSFADFRFQSVYFIFQVTPAFIWLDHLSQIMAPIICYNQNLWKDFDPYGSEGSRPAHFCWKSWYYPSLGFPGWEYQMSSYWNCWLIESRAYQLSGCCLPEANLVAR